MATSTSKNSNTIPVITPSLLTSSVAPVPAPTPLPTENYASLVASSLPSPTPPPPAPPATPATDTSTGLLSKITSLMGLDAGKTDYTQQQNDLAGVTALTQKQNDLTAQLNALNTHAQELANQAAPGGAIENSLQLGARGRGITAGGLAPLSADALRQNQIQQASVASQALTLKATYDLNAGDLVNAKAKAQQAVDLKYKDVESQIQQNQQLLQLYTPFMNAEQQKIAADRTAQNNAALATLNNNRQQQKELIDNALKLGDSATLSSITALDPNDPNFSQKLSAVAAHLDTSSITNANALDMKYKNAQIAKIYSDMNPESNDKLLTVTEAQALGVPYGTTQSQAIGKTPTKAPTAVQETTSLYANRLEQSNEILSKLDKYAAGANPLTFAAQSKLPDVANALKSANFQSLEQAQKNFLNAVLRRESGAVISPSEFAEGKRQYFAQPGDTPETIAQKKANRDLVVKGFVSGSGSAYIPYKPISAPQATTKSGKSFDVAAAKAQGYTQAEIDEYLRTH